MKVLITGATGQLGKALIRTAPESVSVLALDRNALDITNEVKVHAEVKAWGPAVVINAAAYNHVDRAEREREECTKINEWGARNLAAAVRAHGARLVHVSTNYVFDGECPEPYDVTSRPAPLSHYGSSKLAGERAIQQLLGERCVIFRTAWLYDKSGANFLNKMLDLMRKRRPLRVVFDQIGTPTSATSLAGAIWAASGRSDVHGLQHWTDTGLASWFDFAVAIHDEAHRQGVLARPVPIVPIRTREYPTPAERPKYGVLDSTYTYASLSLTPPHWRHNLARTFDEA